MRFREGDVVYDLLGTSCTICITTNGFVKKNGSAVMGRGIAKQISQAIPLFAKDLGAKIDRYGNKCQKVLDYRMTTLVSFPVKPESIVLEDMSQVVAHMRGNFSIGDHVPGWACIADINIIENSARMLAELMDINMVNFPVYLPKPGCGAGELDWNDVKPIIENCLGDRDYYICDFKLAPEEKE